MRFLIAVEKIEANIENEITKQKAILKRIRGIDDNIAQMHQKTRETEQEIRAYDEMKTQRMQAKQKEADTEEKQKRRKVQNALTENSLVYLKVLFKKKVVRPVQVQVQVQVRKKPNMFGARI